MNVSAPFIQRPVATTLLMIAVALAGSVAFRLLPGIAAASSGLPDDQRLRGAARSESGNDGVFSGDAAREAVRTHRRGDEMTSSSSLGSTNITLQFDLNRNIDAAARDVQAAINAARGNLPANLPNNPSYRKVNPADSPIMILALTSGVLSKGQMYDAASTILAQSCHRYRSRAGHRGRKFASVRAGGVESTAIEQIRHRPGAGTNRVKHHQCELTERTLVGRQSYVGDRRERSDVQGGRLRAADHCLQQRRCGSSVGCRQRSDSVEDIRNAGYANGTPSVLVIIFRQPGGNIIATVDRVYAVLPQSKAAIPQQIAVNVAMDQTVTIRASVQEVEKTLIISVILVILVVFFFLRSARTSLIPSVAVPVSLIGTFGVMYLCGYSLDNLSLMALTISTGFVIDDAIVVIENITRYLEMGMGPFQAALKGAQEIGFTVLSISVSLIAVFIPLLLMGGIVGRLFREFAVTLSAAIAVSMLVSLTATPMMCAYLLRTNQRHGSVYLG